MQTNNISRSLGVHVRISCQWVSAKPNATGPPTARTAVPANAIPIFSSLRIRFLIFNSNAITWAFLLPASKRLVHYLTLHYIYLSFQFQMPNNGVKIALIHSDCLYKDRLAVESVYEYLQDIYFELITQRNWIVMIL